MKKKIVSVSIEENYPGLSSDASTSQLQLAFDPSPQKPVSKPPVESELAPPQILKGFVEGDPDYNALMLLKNNLRNSDVDKEINTYFKDQYAEKYCPSRHAYIMACLATPEILENNAPNLYQCLVKIAQTPSKREAIPAFMRKNLNTYLKCTEQEQNERYEAALLKLLQHKGRTPFAQATAEITALYAESAPTIRQLPKTTGWWPSDLLARARNTYSNWHLPSFSCRRSAHK